MDVYIDIWLVKKKSNKNGSNSKKYMCLYIYKKYFRTKKATLNSELILPI